MLNSFALRSSLWITIWYMYHYSWDNVHPGHQ